MRAEKHLTASTELAAGSLPIDRRRMIIAAGSFAAMSASGVAQAQNRDALVGLLMGGTESDPAVPGFLDAIRVGLAGAGWEEGRNLRFAVRFTAGNRELAIAAALQIVAMNPDAILSNTTLNTRTVLGLTQEIPVVFLPIADPVSEGFVDSFAVPGRNATGFTNFEPSHAGKWLGFLLEAAPELRRVALIYNADASPLHGAYYGPAFMSAGVELGIEPLTVAVASQEEIPSAVASLAEVAGTGVVGDASIFMWNARRVVRDAVADHRMPAIYPFVNYTDDGGLMSYSVDTRDLFRRCGEYVGRILNGAQVSSLPVQGPTVFRLVINLGVAEQLGLKIPLSLLVAADEVIE